MSHVSCHELARCEVPGAPLHGSLVTSGDNTVGSTISLACGDGFILIGETIIRCAKCDHCDKM